MEKTFDTRQLTRYPATAGIYPLVLA